MNFGTSPLSSLPPLELEYPLVEVFVLFFVSLDNSDATGSGVVMGKDAATGMLMFLSREAVGNQPNDVAILATGFAITACHGMPRKMDLSKT